MMEMIDRKESERLADPKDRASTLIGLKAIQLRVPFANRILKRPERKSRQTENDHG